MSTLNINQIKEELSFLTNMTVVTCVSTGVDSMVLLSILKDLPIKLIVAHVNHKKRIESDIEQEFITKYCEKNNITIEVMELEPLNPHNFQEEARKRRYQFFDEVVKKYSAEYLITAHHATDDLETILMRFIKGSSLKGYSGIDKLVDKGTYYIYRPLLDYPKSEIYEYAKENHIRYFEDSSNQHDVYLRNRIRHNIVPNIEHENPQIYKAMKDFKEHIVNMNDILFDIIHKFEAKMKKYNNFVSFTIEEFNKYNHYLKVQILFDILKQLSLSKMQVEDLVKQIENDKPLIINDLGNNYYLVKEYNRVDFGIIDTSEVSIKIDAEGIYQIDENTRITIDKNKCYFKDKYMEVCYNIPNLPIEIRRKNDGDKLRYHNNLVSLSDYYTNKKVPHFKRHNLLIVNDKNEVIHILGMEVL